jgi:aspartyl-tRNA synthetase
VFAEFRPDARVTPPPFPRVPYEEAIRRYGSDKPDLRNPLDIRDVTEVFRGSGFAVFAGAIAERGAVVRAVRAPHAAAQPRSFFDKLNQWARDQGAPGLGYVVLADGAARGPIAKFLDETRLAVLRRATDALDGDAVFFVCDVPAAAAKLAGRARGRIAEDLDLVEKDAFRFCWVTDFPMYERNEDTGKIEFSHNPFSMPQCGLEALETVRRHRLHGVRQRAEDVRAAFDLVRFGAHHEGGEQRVEDFVEIGVGVDDRQRLTGVGVAGASSRPSDRQVAQAVD